MITLDQLRSLSAAVVTTDGGHASFTSATTNSRDLESGQLFVALHGARDGHDFLDDAVASGASAVLVSRPYQPLRPGVTVVQVPDTLAALQELGSIIRMDTAADVLAVTGSVGKTTAKNLISHVLASTGRKVLGSPKSFNNYLGVPLTLCLLEPSTTDLIAEVGTNHSGEIRGLVQMVRPRVGLVMNVGFAHLGNFADREGLADEKASLYLGVRPDGVWLVNADDQFLSDAVGRLIRSDATRVLSFGTALDADLRVSELSVTEDGTSGVVTYGDQSAPFTLPLVGRHFAQTVGAALAVAVERGIALADAAAALASFPGSEGRSAISQVGDVRLMDDSYNGSPDSMLAALDTLSTFPEPRRVAVLGEMRELGEWTDQLHREVGAKAGACATHLIFVGESFEVLREAAIEAGLPAERIVPARSATEAAGLLAELFAAEPGESAVLVKGSRFVHMERVALALAGVQVDCGLELCELYIHCRNCPELTR